MRRSSPFRGPCALALAALVLSGSVAAQDGPPPRADSEIGKLILSLQTTDGRPLVGTRVVIDDRAGGEPVDDVFTGPDGTVGIRADVFSDAALGIAVNVDYREASGGAVGSYEAGLTASERFARLDRSARERWEARLAADALALGHGDVVVGVPTVTLTTSGDATCRRRGIREVDVGELFGGCATSEAFEWRVPDDVQVVLDMEVDVGCTAAAGLSSGTPRAFDLVSGRIRALGEIEEPTAGEYGDSFRPLFFGYDGEPIRPDVSIQCAPPASETALPEVAVYGVHGYNIDFEDGAWGVRATAPLPVLRERNLGAAVGLDVYPQDEFRSTLAVNADVTANFPWPALGDASAYVGVGPRAYVQSSDNGTQSSSSTELGAGAVSGMTYGLGPVHLYGDVGVDYVYGAFVPVTHFGVGFAFSGD